MGLFLVMMSAGAMVAARYMHRTNTVNTMTAEEFYFTSDLLDGETHYVSAVDENQTASVTVRLMNHADELRYAEVPINYTVSVTPSDDITIQYPEEGNHILQSGSIQNADVIVSGMKPGQTYTISAETKNQYYKQISGKVIVYPIDETIYHRISDSDHFVEVTVWTKDYSGNIKITYPAALIPDNTDSMMRDWKTGDAAKIFSLEKNSSHVFRFFKGDGYSENGSGVSVNACE